MQKDICPEKAVVGSSVYCILSGNLNTANQIDFDLYNGITPINTYQIAVLRSFFSRIMESVYGCV